MLSASQTPSRQQGNCEARIMIQHGSTLGCEKQIDLGDGDPYARLEWLLHSAAVSVDELIAGENGAFVSESRSDPQGPGFVPLVPKTLKETGLNEYDLEALI